MDLLDNYPDYRVVGENQGHLILQNKFSRKVIAKTKQQLQDNLGGGGKKPEKPKTTKKTTKKKKKS